METALKDGVIEFKLILMESLWQYEADGWQVDRDRPMPHVSLGGWSSIYVWRAVR